MTIVAVGVCVDGKIRKDGFWLNPANGRKEWGITSPTPCEKCGGKGCPKPGAEAAPTAE